jgi:hypothetical protein
LSDEISARHAAEQRLQGFDTARFRNAACNPVDRVEGRQGLLGRIGIGGLGIIDEGDAIGNMATCCMRCARPGKLFIASA